jgi:hypothetical protein
VRQLATDCQRLNEPQILRIEKRIREMPLRVLRKHGVVSVDAALVRRVKLISWLSFAWMSAEAVIGVVVALQAGAYTWRGEACAAGC